MVQLWELLACPTQQSPPASLIYKIRLRYQQACYHCKIVVARPTRSSDWWSGPHVGSGSSSSDSSSSGHGFDQSSCRVTVSSTLQAALTGSLFTPLLQLYTHCFTVGERDATALTG